jgi:hypothetical protein
MISATLSGMKIHLVLVLIRFRVLNRSHPRHQHQRVLHRVQMQAKTIINYARRAMQTI